MAVDDQADEQTGASENGEDEVRPPPGPITDAYLHRNIHPDEKAGHRNPESDAPRATEAEDSPDLWMYD